jgi:squalene-associated FAD-dependent desaturase
VLDNGQHILIGAYSATLDLMGILGITADDVLLRMPMRLMAPDGSGLMLRNGSPVTSFTRAVLAHRAWGWRDKVSLLRGAARWARHGFACDTRLSVAQLCADLRAPVRALLIDPLCVAALNTPAEDASASVFLRVLRDALFSGPGSADLLLPRRSLSDLVPAPAARWLEQADVSIRLSQRVEQLSRADDGWLVNGLRFDAVILAVTAIEAARLVAPLHSEWSALAAALRYEPIVTVYMRSAGMRLPHAMLALESDAHGEKDPAQFVFDLGALSGDAGLLAFVISGAGRWVGRGTEATVQATLLQGQRQLAAFLHTRLSPLRALTEKRATFACTPGLTRPPAVVCEGLVAAGDYVDGPYPATLEGAVRSGLNAARATSKVGAASSEAPA